MSEMLTPRIAPIDPPYRPEVQAEFDKLMRGAPPLLLFALITKPFTYFLNRSSLVILRALGQQAAGQDEAVHSPEEIRLLVIP